MEPFSQRSDESLCRLAASGDREAEETLAARYSRLVRICARPYFLAGGDSEDLIQEGMIGLLSAVRGFRPEEGVTFRAYAEVCIRNRIQSAVKTAAREKHRPLNASVSMDSPSFDESIDTLLSDDPEGLLIGREEQKARMTALREKLSEFEKTVLTLYLNGLSCREIASQTARSPKSVDNAVQRIRRKAAPFLTTGDISAG